MSGLVRHSIVIVLIIIVAISVILNYFQYENSQLLRQEIINYKNQNDQYAQKLSKIPSETVVKQKENGTIFKPFIPTNINNLSISAVAVTPILQSDGFFETTTYVGTVLKIFVEIRDGTGQVLVNTAVPTGVDFQTSARTAVLVAQNTTKIDLSKKDVIFSISSDNQTQLQAVDGGSAGGAMTVLLISDISGKPINNKVLMTGTIESDGTIGQIGGVAEKADAAGKNGAKIFLVPPGQSITQIQSCDERKEGIFTYRSCTLQDKSLSDITEKEYNMKVIEIQNIMDALRYFNSNGI